MVSMYNTLALSLLFGKVGNKKSLDSTDLLILLDQHGLQYRKGKTIADVVNARSKALKNGLGKTENEIGFFELYLKDVLKKNNDNAFAVCGVDGSSGI